VILNGVTAGPIIAPTVTINENGGVSIEGIFRDPGVLDGETVSVNWGEGAAVNVTVTTDAVDPHLHHFSASHIYLDDNPSGTPFDDYVITVTATDKDGGTASTSAKVRVTNVPPVVSNLQLSTTTVNEDGTVTVVLTGNVSDTGTQDTHTVFVDWGDGTRVDSSKDPNTVVTYSEVGGQGKFTATHIYRDDNPTGTPQDIN